MKETLFHDYIFQSYDSAMLQTWSFFSYQEFLFNYAVNESTFFWEDHYFLMKIKKTENMSKSCQEMMIYVEQQ